MATLTISNSFVAGTDALASEVNQNFTDVKTFVNTQVVHRDGTNPFTVMPVLPSGLAAAVSTNAHAANKAYVDAEKTDVLNNGKPVNVSWGFVGSANKTVRQAVTSTSYVNVTSTTVSFTAATDRRYSVLAQFTLESDTDTDHLAYVALTDGNDVVLSSSVVKFFVNTAIGSGTCFAYVTPSAGTFDVKLRAKTTAGGDFDVVAAFVTVEDVGPVGLSGGSLGLAEV